MDDGECAEFYSTSFDGGMELYKTTVNTGDLRLVLCTLCVCKKQPERIENRSNPFTDSVYSNFKCEAIAVWAPRCGFSGFPFSCDYFQCRKCEEKTSKPGCKARGKPHEVSDFDFSAQF